MINTNKISRYAGLIMAVFILTAISPTQSKNSDETARMVLKDYVHFKNTVVKNWEYQCSKDHYLRKKYPDIENRIQQFVESVIFEGLKKLEDLNPELAYYIVNSEMERHILLFCQDDPDPVSPNALPFVNSMRGKGIMKWFYTERIYLGRISNYAANYSTALKELAESTDSNVEKRRVLFEQERQFYAQVLFHEFLHSAEIDNFSEEMHNDKVHGVRGYYQDDLVYACSTHVFPFGYAKLNNLPFYTRLALEALSEDMERRYLYTKRACMTCASTRKGMEEASAEEGYRHTLRAQDKCKDAIEVWIDVPKQKQFQNIGDLLDQLKQPASGSNEENSTPLRSGVN